MLEHAESACHGTDFSLANNTRNTHILVHKYRTLMYFQRRIIHTRPIGTIFTLLVHQKVWYQLEAPRANVVWLGTKNSRIRTGNCLVGPHSAGNMIVYSVWETGHGDTGRRFVLAPKSSMVGARFWFALGGGIVS